MRKYFRFYRATKNYLCICFFIILAIRMAIGCKKFVQVSAPVTSLNSGNVYSSDATAISVLNGVYDRASTGGYGSIQSITSCTFVAGLSADELSLYNNLNSQFLAYYINNLSPITAGYEIWNDVYPQIYILNSAIEGLNSSTGTSLAVRNQLLGEAKFMRAFYYFYLVNLYGDVPLVTTSNYIVNQALGKTPASQVYDQIVTDLEAAQSLLSGQYLDATLLNPTQDRTRPTRWAATALLARTYLYLKNWKSADSAASAVISNSAEFTLSTLNDVFLKTSPEAIWQLQPVNSGQNTQDALLFILPSTGPNTTTYPVYLDTSLVNSFEPGDQRRTQWVDSVSVSGTIYYYPYKYKINELNAAVNEYTMVLRLGEQYLIRAEAETQLTGMASAQAISDIDTIRNRAGLPNYSGLTDMVDFLNEIYHERRIELFVEWGNRWLDLKRTGMVDSVMTLATKIKGGNWSTYQQLYPLPASDIKTDPNLTQNLGY